MCRFQQQLSQCRIDGKMSICTSLLRVMLWNIRYLELHCLPSQALLNLSSLGILIQVLEILMAPLSFAVDLPAMSRSYDLERYAMFTGLFHRHGIRHTPQCHSVSGKALSASNLYCSCR